MSKDAPTYTLSILVPVYNEAGSIEDTLHEIFDACEALEDREGEDWWVDVVAINDGSTDGSLAILEEYAEAGDIELVSFAENRGYGAALQAGATRAGDCEYIALIDADGTYPAKRLPDLAALILEQGGGMVVGARTGSKVAIPWQRKPAKWAINQLANYVAGTRIPDLNSGLRIIEKRLFEKNRHLLPQGFSLTTTITMALITQGALVRFEPINYAKRIGKSSIRPIRDTLGFTLLILRMALYFDPLKVFLPLSAGLFFGGVGVALFSKLFLDELMDVSSIVLVMAGLQLFALGLLADLIVRRFSARS